MTGITPGYIRVSEILSIVPSISSETPLKFSYPLHSIDEEVLRNKSHIGTSVHAAIDHHARNDFFPLSDAEQGYFNSFLKWAEFVKLVPVRTEIRVENHALKISGGVDMIATLEGSDKWRLIDFKCTVNEDAKKWRLQAAFYADLLKHNKVGVFPSALFVKLDKQGEMPDVYEYKIDAYMETATISWYNAFKYVTGR